jgi:hypothetical protein
MVTIDFATQTIIKLLTVTLWAFHDKGNLFQPAGNGLGNCWLCLHSLKYTYSEATILEIYPAAVRLAVIAEQFTSLDLLTYFPFFMIYKIIFFIVQHYN